MKIEQFFYLMQIAKYQSISIASEYCFTSAQNVSKQICALEKELGITLFKRTRHGIIITPDGENVLKSAEIICKETERLQEQYINHRTEVDLLDIKKFSIISTPNFLQMSKELLKNMLQKNKDLKVSLINAEPPFIASTDEYMEFMQKKILDYNLIFSLADEYNFDSLHAISDTCHIFSLLKEPICLEVSKKSELAQKSTVPLKNLKNISLVAFGVSGKENIPFYHGSIARKYNLSLSVAAISNIGVNNENNFSFLPDFATLRTPYGFTVNNYTKLVPLQEKCMVHHVMMVPKNKDNFAFFEDIILPFTRKKFPNLYQMN